MKPHPRPCRDVWLVARPWPTQRASPHTTQRPQPAPHGVMAACCFGAAENPTRLALIRRGRRRVVTARQGARTCSHRFPTVCRSPHVCLAALWPTPHAAIPLCLCRPAHHDRDRIRRLPITMATLRLAQYHIDHFAMYYKHGPFVAACLSTFFPFTPPAQKRHGQSRQSLQYTPFRQDSHPLPRTGSCPGMHPRRHADHMVPVS